MPSPFKARLHRSKQIVFALVHLPVVIAAIVWRRTILRHATVIAVSGSVGKTTSKECLASILRSVAPTLAASSGANGRTGIPRLLLQGRPHHRFIVVEVGILKPGRMWRSAFLVNPDVTIITHVNWQHSRNYESLDQIAEQKAILLNPLGHDGLAVLNADDERVAAMAEGRDCQVRTFGLNAPADVRAEKIEGQWPDTLSFTVWDGQEERHIRTRLMGQHWVPSILAAVATARSLGASWSDCTTAIEQLAPFPARLNQLRLPNGADLLRDEYNGSFATFERGLDILSQARCKRRVIAIGHIQDTPQFGEQGPEEVGKRCAATGDLLFFWGTYRTRYRDAAIAAGAVPDSVFIFETLTEMAAGIRRETRTGDLILLKGTWFDHMSRVVYAQFGTIACKIEPCLVNTICDCCPRMGFRPDSSVDPSLIKPLRAGQARIRGK